MNFSGNIQLRTKTISSSAEKSIDFVIFL